MAEDCPRMSMCLGAHVNNLGKIADMYRAEGDGRMRKVGGGREMD